MLPTPASLPLAAEVEKQLAHAAHDYACTHGIVMYSKSTGHLTHAPFTLFPSPIPRHCYKQAVEVGPDFNLLVEMISRDPGFIQNTLSSTASDPFTARLLDIYAKVLQEKPKQKAISLGIHRSDYMLDTSRGGVHLKQVEINTIAASFSNLSSFVTRMHKHLCASMSFSSSYPSENLPNNDSHLAMSKALATAFNLYGEKKAVVVMIVHPGETNTFDQRWIEYNLWDNDGIRLIRRSLSDFAERGHVDPTTNELSIDGEKVAIVYYRSGYAPEHYPSEKEWHARLLIESSLAVKCPSISYHLIGTKKMQQVLARPGMVENFISDPSSVKRLRDSFTGLYSLTEGDEGVKEAISAALARPQDYVLKPQREGGGNNYYGEDVKRLLQTLSPAELSTYILMDRIVPPSVATIMLREGKVIPSQGVSELGIYGIYVSRHGSTILNEVRGHLLRTKLATVEDGGVAAGVAVLDSPFLI